MDSNKRVIDDTGRLVPMSKAKFAHEDPSLPAKLEKAEGTVKDLQAQLNQIRDCILSCNMVLESDKTVAYSACSLIKAAYKKRGDLSGSVSQVVEKKYEEDINEVPKGNDPSSPAAPKPKPEKVDTTGRRPDAPDLNAQKANHNPKGV